MFNCSELDTVVTTVLTPLRSSRQTRFARLLYPVELPRHELVLSGTLTSLPYLELFVKSFSWEFYFLFFSI